jgi:hypothetical protein
LVNELDPNLKVEFLGNAPFGVYKLKNNENVGEKVIKKIFFFKTN